MQGLNLLWLLVAICIMWQVLYLRLRLVKDVLHIKVIYARPPLDTMPGQEQMDK